jgi:hypothetical protein
MRSNIQQMGFKVCTMKHPLSVVNDLHLYQNIGHMYIAIVLGLLNPLLFDSQQIGQSELLQDLP